MADNGRFDNTSMIEFTGKVVVVAIICLSCVSIFVFCLHLYSKWFWDHNTTTTTTTTRRRRRRLDFADGNQETTAVLHRGLDPILLKALPVIVFDPKEFKDELECAVCLCEVSEGEKARVLPKCNHGFHLDCIDMWFQSHSTCPLCRNSVGVHNQSNLASETILEDILDDAPIGENSIGALNFPNEIQVRNFSPCDVGVSSSSSSSSVVPTCDRRDGMLLIDILREINEDEEHKAQVPTRLESFKRLLSGSRRVNPSSPRNLDIEQGGYPQS